MASDTPLISRGLRLVSIAIIISIVAIAASAGYSGYQEYRALTNLASSTNTSQFTASFNGTKFEVSGLTVPNNMTYPLDLQLLGHLSVQNQSVGTFDSGKKVIPPGQVGVISLNSQVNFTNVLSNSEALRSILLNASALQINLTVMAEIYPLVAINITSLNNSTMGPILEGFQAHMAVSEGTLSPDGSEYYVPIMMSWTNLTPIVFNGSIQMIVSRMPGSTSAGSYGSASGPFDLVSGQNSEMINATFPASEFGGGPPPSGNYTLEITVTTNGGSNATFSQEVSA